MDPQRSDVLPGKSVFAMMLRYISEIVLPVWTFQVVSELLFQPPVKSSTILCTPFSLYNPARNLIDQTNLSQTKFVLWLWYHRLASTIVLQPVAASVGSLSKSDPLCKII